MTSNKKSFCAFLATVKTILTPKIKHVHLLVLIWQWLQTPTTTPTTPDTKVQPLGRHIANNYHWWWFGGIYFRDNVYLLRAYKLILSCAVFRTSCWTIRRNSHLSGGEMIWSARTLEQCQSTCMDDKSCVAIDWDPLDEHWHYCWTHVREDRAYVITRHDQSTLYGLNRTCLGQSHDGFWPESWDLPLFCDLLSRSHL